MSRSSTVTRVVPMEIAQLADEGGFIAGVAGTMWAMTLVGLAIGFVLLRYGKKGREGEGEEERKRGCLKKSALTGRLCKLTRG